MQSFAVIPSYGADFDIRRRHGTDTSEQQLSQNAGSPSPRILQLRESEVEMRHPVTGLLPCTFNGANIGTEILAMDNAHLLPLTKAFRLISRLFCIEY